jgi:NADH:ubiquinone oxidoreductase subunit 6 (subunit J)
VMVMFLFVIAYIGPRSDSPWAGGPSWQAVGAVLAAAALLVEIIVVIGLKAGGRLADSADLREGFGSPA